MSNGHSKPRHDLEQIRDLALRLREAILSTDPASRPFQFRDFPRLSCGDAALLVGTLLCDCGFGRFIYAWGRRGNMEIDTRTSQAWAEQDGLIVDIAADGAPDAPEAVVVTMYSPWHAGFESDGRPRHDAHLDVLEGPAMPELREFYAELKRRMGFE